MIKSCFPQEADPFLSSIQLHESTNWAIWYIFC